jgi:hypothetical protein
VNKFPLTLNGRFDKKKTNFLFAVLLRPANKTNNIDASTNRNLFYCQTFGCFGHVKYGNKVYSYTIIDPKFLEFCKQHFDWQNVYFHVSVAKDVTLHFKYPSDFRIPFKQRCKTTCGWFEDTVRSLDLPALFALLPWSSWLGQHCIESCGAQQKWKNLMIET